MPIGSGTQRLQLNTRERVLSSDANRAQAFQAQALANVLRALVSVTADEDANAGSVEVLPTGSDTPLRGTVLSGLRCQPVDGTTDMLITPGVVVLSDNATPTADDSADAIVVDPGVRSTGILLLTPGSGSVRIDVLEVQRVTVVVETDNRDQFNPATGIFQPVQVDKVVSGRLAYRIRTGTGGAGFPGVTAGWLPIAVFSVPGAATTWDTVTMWDVRPLASDRWNAPHNTPHVMNERGRAFVFTDVTTAPSERRVMGLVEASLAGYKAGGRLALTSTVDAVGWIDVAASANRAANFPGYVANQYWYLYACFPFGLPRWVRYTDSGAGGRVPRGQRGILSVTSTAPDFTGKPNAFGIGVASPSVHGLHDNSPTAICLLAGRVDAAGTPVPQGIAVDGHVCSHVNPIAAVITAGASTVDGVSVEWAFTDGISHPAGARAIYIRFHSDFTSTGAFAFTAYGHVTVSAGDADNTSMIVCPDMGSQRYQASAAQQFNYDGVTRVPLVSDPGDPSAGGGSTRIFRVRWSYDFLPNPGVGTLYADLQSYEVIAWEMGP